MEEMNGSVPKFPTIEVQLSGEDGNVFAVIGRVTSAMRRGGVSKEAIGQFTKEVTASESYDQALECVMRWVLVW